jgi:hypothetical protein
MESVADLPKRAQELGLTQSAWETSREGVKFLRTPRDQALVVSRDIDLYEIQFHTIQTGPDLRSCALRLEYTLGENVDWTKAPYQERPASQFDSVEEMLIERETDLVLLIALRFGPRRSCVGLLFGNEEHARNAVIAAHKALWDDAKLRLPLWAHHALAAGWTAPEGWQP